MGRYVEINPQVSPEEDIYGDIQMSGDQNPYPVSLTVRNLLTVAYETQGLAYGARFSRQALTALTVATWRAPNKSLWRLTAQHAERFCLR